MSRRWLQSRRRRRLPLLLLATLAISLLLAIAASADADMRITWYAFTGGGGQSHSTHYTLDGTLGQPAAGAASSAHFRLGGGFWYVLGAPEVTTEHLYLPVLLKRYP
jgi:hypothetical protein